MAKDRAAKVAKSVLACALGAALPLLFLFFRDDLYVSDLGINAKQMIFASNLFFAGAVFVALCLIGLPVQYVMQQCRITHILWHVLPAAVAGGVLVAWLVNPHAFLSGSVYGAVSATIAWLVRRPDKDAA